MRDSLPTVADVRAIQFKAQRKKNIIPQHASLTHEFNIQIVRLFDKLSTEVDPSAVLALSDELRDLLARKKDHEDALFTHLRASLENRVLRPPTSIRLRTREIAGRTVTVFNKSRSTLMLFDRFAAMHLSRAFGVQTKGRDQCVRILKNTFMISSRAPTARQGVIKMDLEQYYASIDHERLLEKVDNHAGVPRFVKQHVRLILNAYSRLHGDSRGIPDGVPSSAVLAEIYMENFDASLRGNPEVALYLRYVDDIVIVCGPNGLKRISIEIDGLLRKDKLSKNLTKSKELAHPSKLETSFDFLGYKFKFAELTSKLLAVDISDAKYKRYIQATQRMSTRADAVTCWASTSSVDDYLAMFEYLYRPHATADSGHGVRIVTGLAYSSRFMTGTEADRENFREIAKLSKVETAQRWGRMKKTLLPGSEPVCTCCGGVIPRWRELFALNSRSDLEFEIMGSAATPHLDDDLRAHVGGILWN